MKAGYYPNDHFANTGKMVNPFVTGGKWAEGDGLELMEEGNFEKDL